MAFKTVFDPDFKYRRAESTDVRLTFARVRREQRRAKGADDAAPLTAKVVPIGAAPHGAWPFDSREKATG